MRSSRHRSAGGEYQLQGYTEREREQLLRLVIGGMTKTQACAALVIPLETVSSWVMYDEGFADRWRQARIEQAHSLADEAIRISNEPIEPGDMAGVQRNRLRVDTLKWFTSKVAPKLYGDRVLQEHRHHVGVVILPALQPQPAVQQAVQQAVAVVEPPRVGAGGSG